MCMCQPFGMLSTAANVQECAQSLGMALELQGRLVQIIEFFRAWVQGRTFAEVVKKLAA